MYRREGRSRALLLALLVTSASLITLDLKSTTLLDPLRNGSQSAVAPLQRTLSAAARPLGNAIASLGELTRLRARTEELEAEVARLAGHARQTQALLEENAELRAHLGLARSWAGAERLTAQVIADAPGNYRWSVVIDRGTADGIARDMPVLVPEGLVGKIIRADANQATVLLLVDPAAGAAARIEGGSASGVVTGNGMGRALSLEFVDKDAGVGVGDRVLTSNLNRGLFPAGIPIGTVVDVEGDERLASLQIDVAPSADLQHLNFVEVLLIRPASIDGVATP